MAEPAKVKVILEGLDMMSTIKFASKISKKHQASLLTNIERVLDDAETYAQVRKFVLDETNDMIRDVLSSIFGKFDI